MAYREKGRAATTLTNDKHPVYGNGHSKPSNDSKRDRYRLRELTEGIREVAMNIDHIPAGALEELEEAIKLLATSRSKVQHVIVNEPIKSTSVNGRVPSTNQMRITANQLESEIEQLRADVLKLSNEADSLKVINTNRLNDLQTKYVGDWQEATDLFGKMNRLFMGLDRHICSPQLLSSMLKDIEGLYQAVAQCLTNRKKYKDGIGHYLRDFQRMDLSSDEES